MRDLRNATAVLALLCAVATLLARACSQLSWFVDLIATFALHAAYGFGVLGLILLGTRFRVAGMVWLAAALIHFGWSLAEDPPRAAEGAETVRVMSFNIRFGEPRAEPILELIASGPADVIFLSESKQSFNDALRASKRIAEQYPYQVLFHNFAKLSRWPLEVVPTQRRKGLEHNYNYRLSVVVQHPTTPFLLLALAPNSPRTADHWAEGNRYLEQQIALFERFFVPLDRPVLVLGDLNGSPTGWRSKMVRDRFGLTRAKPPLVLSGSWPANLPAPLRVPIDAVLMGPGISVASWRVLEVETGSDHMPVVAEIALPTGSGSGVTPRSRPAAAPD